MIDFPAQLVLQIMNDRAGRADRLRQVGAAEAVERFNFEMFAKGEAGVLRQEGVVIVGERSDALEFPRLLSLTSNGARRGNRLRQVASEAVERFYL